MADPFSRSAISFRVLSFFIPYIVRPRLAAAKLSTPCILIMLKERGTPGMRLRKLDGVPRGKDHGVSGRKISVMKAQGEAGRSVLIKHSWRE